MATDDTVDALDIESDATFGLYRRCTQVEKLNLSSLGGRRHTGVHGLSRVFDVFHWNVSFVTWETRHIAVCANVPQWYAPCQDNCELPRRSPSRLEQQALDGSARIAQQLEEESAADASR
jgi:hypothetical protein